MNRRNGFIVSAVVALIAVIIFVFLKAEKINSLLTRFKRFGEVQVKKSSEDRTA